MYFMFPPRVVYKLWALGGWMDAEQAHQLQYVQRVVPMEDLESTALHWAEQCALIDPEGFKATKKGMHEMYEAMGLPEMVEDRHEADAHAEPGGDREEPGVQQGLAGAGHQGGARAPGRRHGPGVHAGLVRRVTVRDDQAARGRPHPRGRAGGVRAERRR